MQSQSQQYWNDPAVSICHYSGRGVPSIERAPSIEAIIHWQAHASQTLDSTTLRDELMRRLPDYPICQPQQTIAIEASNTSDTSDGSSEVRHRTQ